MDRKMRWTGVQKRINWLEKSRHPSTTLVTQRGEKKTKDAQHWGPLIAKAMHYGGAACDGVVGSKRTHMGGYVEQRLAQSTNGRTHWRGHSHSCRQWLNTNGLGVSDHNQLVGHPWPKEMRIHPTAFVQNYWSNSEGGFFFFLHKKKCNTVGKEFID